MLHCCNILDSDRSKYINIVLYSNDFTMMFAIISFFIEHFLIKEVLRSLRTYPLFRRKCCTDRTFY